MRSAARRPAEVEPRPFLSTERHPLIGFLRQTAIQRAKELEMMAGQIALLVHNVPEDDAEITKWLGAADRAIFELGRAIGWERTLRDTEGVA